MEELGPQQQIEDWFLSYGDDVYNFLLYFQGSPDVEDLVQETFLRAMRSLHQFQGQSSPKTWLLKIARNLAIDQGRRKKPVLGVADEWLNHLPSIEQTPEQQVEQKDSSESLMRLLQALDPKHRDALILRCVYDYSFAQMAEMLGCNEVTARSRFHRGKKQAESLLNGLGKGGALA